MYYQEEFCFSFSVMLAEDFKKFLKVLDFHLPHGKGIEQEWEKKTFNEILSATCT